MISLGKNPILIHADGSFENIEQANHLSLPPDLRLHITSHNYHIRFDVSSIWDMLNNLSLIPATHLFTFIDVPFAQTKPLVSRRKVWQQAVLIAPIPDKDFSSDTRMCIEFFIHSTEFKQKDIEVLPFTIPKMNLRAAPDPTGAIFGPYWFGELQRRDCNPRLDLMYSIRMCYAAPQDSRPVSFTFVPLPEFDRRPRTKRRLT